jgi:hypothetical protein
MARAWAPPIFADPLPPPWWGRVERARGSTSPPTPGARDTPHPGGRRLIGAKASVSTTPPYIRQPSVPGPGSRLDQPALIPPRPRRRLRWTISINRRPYDGAARSTARDGHPNAAHSPGRWHGSKAVRRPWFALGKGHISALSPRPGRPCPISAGVTAGQCRWWPEMVQWGITHDLFDPSDPGGCHVAPEPEDAADLRRDDLEPLAPARRYPALGALAREARITSHGKHVRPPSAGPDSGRASRTR